MPDLSIMERLALNARERAAFLQSLTAAEIRALPYKWDAWARPKQLPPAGDDWDVWFVKAGRGWGKTRVGAEFVRGEVEAGRAGRIALVAATAADARDVMVEGESGLLAVSPPWFRPAYEPSKRRLTWPNGAMATCFSADEPRQLRGPQHDLAWCDEVAAWRFEEAWDNMEMGLRLGAHPRAVVTTTPRPTTLIKQLLKDTRVRVTHGTTYENAANLADTFRRRVLERYEGTRLGKQELGAELLEDTPGALWKQAAIDALRVRHQPEDLERIVIAVDPSVAADGGGDECGIVVVGVGRCMCTGEARRHAFVLEDVSGNMSPDDWGKRVVDAYFAQRADRVVAEVNNGGALVEVNLRTQDRAEDISYKAVHASRGKRARAEPVAAMYEQGKVHHVGAFPQLEGELTTWDAASGAPSPNRLDALVWGLTELMLEDSFFIV